MRSKVTLKSHLNDKIIFLHCRSKTVRALLSHSSPIWFIMSRSIADGIGQFDLFLIFRNVRRHIPIIITATIDFCSTDHMFVVRHVEQPNASGIAAHHAH